MKICQKCKIEKPLSSFSRNCRRKDGLHNWCRDCNSVQNKKYLKTHKEDIKVYKHEWNHKNTSKRASYNLKHYGLTLEEYDTLFEKQNGVCAICGNHGSRKRRLNVDHNHVTGKVRGLLCDSCNMGLGCFKDNLDTLLAAALYVERN